MKAAERVLAALAVAACAAAPMPIAAATPASCAIDIPGLRRLAGDPEFPLRWVETGMDDGKPLRLRIEQREGALFWQFDKAREGPWAAGRGMVCLHGARLQALFAPGELQAGPAAGWLLRGTLQRSARFDLVRSSASEMQVGTIGWRGRFAPDSD
jgi:hypothetical protein